MLTSRRHSQRRLLHSRSFLLVPVAVLLAGIAFYLRYGNSSGFHLPDTLKATPDPVGKSESGPVNHPGSPHRPWNQFTSLKHSLHPPSIAIGTLVQDSSVNLLAKTYKSLDESSLSTWRWYIVDLSPSGSPSPMAKSLQKLDQRITVLTALASSSTMNMLLDLFTSSEAPFGLFLSPTTMLEPTILEKMVWSLHSIPSWSFVGHFIARYGEDETTVTSAGAHSHAQNLEQNLVPDTAAFRLQVAVNSSCSFDTGSSGSAALWGFWMCFALHGHWGGTIPEVGAWVRKDVLLPEGEPQAVLQARNWFADHQFPHADIAKYTALEPVFWNAPVRTELMKPGKSIMIVQGSLINGGSELGCLDILRHLASTGHRVTMVLTRLKYPVGLTLRPQASQYTNDIHVLPSLLRLNDFPRYIKYLIDTRGIDLVLISNTQLMYEILPAITEMTPGVKWVDYLYNEAYNGWKTNGFPAYSSISQRYLARTLTSSAHLRQLLISRGADPDHLGVVKLGINTTRFSFTPDSARQEIKRQLLGVKTSTIVLVSSSHLDGQKRASIVPEIISTARESVWNTCQKEVLMIMIGDGPLRDNVASRIQELGLERHVILAGHVEDPIDLIRGSDLYLLPSFMEGISTAVAEAMSLGLPVVTSQVGGLPEQLGDQGNGQAVAGRLISITNDDSVDAALFGEAIVDLACDDQRRLRMGRGARDLVAATFDQQRTLPAITREFGIARRTRIREDSEAPNPASHYGLQGMSLDDFFMVDLQATQKQLSRVKLPGLVGEVQSRCNLEGVHAMKWIEAVANGLLCNDVAPLEKEGIWLLKAGKEQCGAWCLWDLRTRKMVGWRFNGNCFSRMEIVDEASDGCAEYFYTRPSIDFYGGGASAF